MKKLLILLLLLLPFSVYGAAISTAGAGNWSAVGTWNGGVVPNTGDDVTINHNVTVDQDIAFNSLTLGDGTGAKLIFDSTDRTVTVDDGGSIQMSGSSTEKIDCETNDPTNIYFTASVGATNFTFDGGNGSGFQLTSANGGMYGASTNYHFEYCTFLSHTNFIRAINSGIGIYFDETCSFSGDHGSGGSFSIQIPAYFTAGKTYNVYNTNGATNHLLFTDSVIADGDSSNVITFNSGAYSDTGEFHLSQDNLIDTLTIDYCDFVDLSRGIHTVTYNNIATITNCNIYNGTIGISLTTNTSGAELHFENCNIFSNSSYGFVAGNVATADFIWSLTDCNFYSNTGITVRMQDGIDANLAITRVKIYSGGSWGIATTDHNWTGDVNFTNILVYENTFDGMLLYEFTDLDIVNCTISDNNTDGIVGWLSGGKSIAITNSIISSNGGDGIDENRGGATPTVTYSLVYGNSESNYEGMADPTGTNGNFSSDPYFIDAASDNYMPRPPSKAIAGGTASGAPADDVDSNSRPNPAGTNPDMGAYESPFGNWVYFQGDTLINGDTHLAP